MSRTRLVLLFIGCRIIWHNFRTLLDFLMSVYVDITIIIDNNNSNVGDQYSISYYRILCSKSTRATKTAPEYLLSSTSKLEPIKKLSFLNWFPGSNPRYPYEVPVLRAGSRRPAVEDSGELNM